jgi:hypothetical protein
MGHDTTRDRLLDTAAHRAYGRLYQQPWDDGSPIGHDEARNTTTALDVATVAGEQLHRAELLVSLLDAALYAITLAETLDAAQGIAHAAQHREEYHA